MIATGSPLRSNLETVFLSLGTQGCCIQENLAPMRDEGSRNLCSGSVLMSDGSTQHFFHRHLTHAPIAIGRIFLKDFIEKIRSGLKKLPQNTGGGAEMEGLVRDLEALIRHFDDRYSFKIATEVHPRHDRFHRTNSVARAALFGHVINEGRVINEDLADDFYTMREEHVLFYAPTTEESTRIIFSFSPGDRVLVHSRQVVHTGKCGHYVEDTSPFSGRVVLDGQGIFYNFQHTHLSHEPAAMGKKMLDFTVRAISDGLNSLPPNGATAVRDITEAVDDFRGWIRYFDGRYSVDCLP